MANHPVFQIPTDPHGKKRYESAMKHVEAAKKAGKSSDEIHAIFKRIMSFDPQNIDSIPKDVVHAKAAMESGKSSAEAHELFRKIMSGETTGHCKQ